jgi:hypothetical protein
MSINTEQRQQLVKHLAQALAKASGYDVNQAGVSQWEIAADALVKAIEGIVHKELHEAFTAYDLKPPLKP